MDYDHTLPATSSSKIDTLILSILGGGWFSRRAISGQVANIYPDATTVRIYNRLVTLVRRGIIAPPHSEPCDGISHSIHSLRPLSDADKERCRKLVGLKCRVLDTWTMGKLGEALVRALTLSTGLYRRVTPFKLIGLVKPDDTADEADLIAEHHDPAVGHVLFEVKNCEQHIEVGNEAIHKLIAKAQASDALPILVASYISPQTFKFCNYYGIGAMELGLQVVPAGTLKALRRCHRVIHLPDLVPLMRGSRVFKNLSEMPGWTTPITQALEDRRRLLTLRRRWNANQEWLSQNKGTSWRELREEMESRIASRTAA